MYINLSNLKSNIITKYPQSSLAKILANEPETLTAEQFLAKVSIWLSLAELEDAERRSS